jgi:hypothetical protein
LKAELDIDKQNGEGLSLGQRRRKCGHTPELPPERFIGGPSRIVKVRLKKSEYEHLVNMVESCKMNCSNKSEFIRMLLAREWNRRTFGDKRSSAVADCQWRTEWRRGVERQKSNGS